LTPGCKPSRSAAIRTFKHKGLAELFSRSRTGKIDGRMHKRILRRLEALNRASAPEDMAVPSFDSHELAGHRKGTCSIHANGPWCITFEWNVGNARLVDFEQYH